MRECALGARRMLDQALVTAGSANDGPTKPTHRPAARSKRRKIENPLGHRAAK
jgi:hypothetical protein